MSASAVSDAHGRTHGAKRGLENGLKPIRKPSISGTPLLTLVDTQRLLLGRFESQMAHITSLVPPISISAVPVPRLECGETFA